MSYQVIARKWRPKNFTELVGQQHVSQTLINALKSGRLHHALLFTGPRGTGKTSSARIVAKSVRCTQGQNFQPCNTCNDCLEIAAGNSINVIEIDGASNNGVDAIRNLRETIAFFPTSGKYKIYIIDEVHMLSTSAFNALLKTLEEPPDHVVFILATTEVQKIPQTILSRCQRFDFRSISLKIIVQKLKSICEAEKIQFEEESLWIIARQGGGSMRDSESLLDQVLNFSNGQLTVQSVIENLGLSDSRLILDTLKSLVDRNSAELMLLLKKFRESGLNPTNFMKDLLHSLRNLLLIKMDAIAGANLDLSDYELEFLKNLSTSISFEDIHMLFDMSLKGSEDLARSTESQITFEMILLRMVVAPYVMQLSNWGQNEISVNREVSATREAPPIIGNPSVGRHASAGTGSSGNTSASFSTGTTAGSTSYSSPDSSAKSIRPEPNTAKPPVDRWTEAVQFMRSADALFAAKIENLAYGSEKDKAIEFTVPASLSFIKEQLMDSAMHKKMQTLIDRYWGPGYTFTIRLAQQGTKVATPHEMSESKKLNLENSFKQNIADNPQVKAAAMALKGKIKAVRKLTKDQV